MPAPAPSSHPPTPGGVLRIPDPLLKWPDLYTQATLASQLEAHGGIPTPLTRQTITELFALVSSVFSSTFATGAQLAAGRMLVDDVMARISKPLHAPRMLIRSRRRAAPRLDTDAADLALVEPRCVSHGAGRKAD